jgi:putative transposase
MSSQGGFPAATHAGGAPAGLEAEMEEAIGSAWQRFYVHFLRNALDYLPRKVDDDCLMELR